MITESILLELTTAQVADLRERLARARWPDAETVDDWSQGVPLAYLRPLAAYWADGYDMERLARRLGAFPSFRATVDGQEIAFLHIRSPRPDARAVILTHGWPGSIVEFLEVIEPLARDHHLVVPCLPGFGWSAAPTEPGVGIERIGQLWDGLMRQLGYERYYAQGGDWGAILAWTMSRQAPAGLAGVHVNLMTCDPRVIAGLEDLQPSERTDLDKLEHYRRRESGYAKQQGTRPQTLGYGLADSPVGQLAWVIEKFRGWTDADGNPERAVDRDALLDNVMVYWLTNTATSSARLYWESTGAMASFEPIPGPLAYSRFPQEIFTFSERCVRTRVQELTYFGEPAAGGHFAALEVPELFIEEFRAGIASLPD